MSADILIVDDAEDIRDLVSGILDDEGYQTRTASDSDSALEAIKARRPSLVILDIWLHGSKLDGLSILDIIKKQHPELPVIMFSGHGNIETAVASIKRGAYDYIEKPFKSDRLVLMTHRALETFNLRREVNELKKRAEEYEEFIGDSQEIVKLRETIERIAKTNSRVMIFGPSGAGKELAARCIHRYSNRANGPFVSLNTSAISPARIEEELFGKESKGGIIKKTGVFEEAHGGTLYLDEIAGMPIEIQNKLVAVISEQGFTRIGGVNKVSVSLRVISSTSQNFEEEIKSGNFREDLFHRLNVVPLTVPGLADHLEDVPKLIKYFMDQIARINGLPKRRISNEVMAILQVNNWPGNVRQLRNNVERLMILTQSKGNSEITVDMLPAEIGSVVPEFASKESDNTIMSIPLKDAREKFERDYLASQLNRFNGNISRTADFIKMDRSSLYRKLKSLDLV